MFIVSATKGADGHFWLAVAGSSAITNNGNAIIITINGACVPVRSVSKSSQGHTRALELKYLSGERT